METDTENEPFEQGGTTQILTNTYPLLFLHTIFLL